MTNQLWFYGVWVLVGGLIGFGISALFFGQLHFSRRLSLTLCFVLSGALLYGFLRWSQVDLAMFVDKHWYGAFLGAIVGVLVVRKVRSRPSSQ
jgi:hypothetical protein